MDEIEIKLQVPPEERAAVEAAVAGREAAPAVRLQAAYFDTAGRALARAHLALRLRRDGRRWEQTLKGAGDDGLTRSESNQPRGSGAALPSLDPALHRGTEAGDRLLGLLDSAPGEPLLPLFRTDIRRRRRTVAVRGGGRGGAQVELAYDAGRILAGDEVLPVAELEVELVEGTPLAVLDVARRWQARHRLWLDLRSKAERGDLLARGLTVAEARHATALELPPRVTVAEAWQAVLRNCADQILGNASQIASGSHTPEHVHQLRIGLRRLRSALKLFERQDAVLADGARTLFRALGQARDPVATEAEFGPGLRRAMQASGLAEAAAVAAAPPVPGPSDGLLRQASSQTLLLDVLAAMHAAPAPDSGLPWRAQLEPRLDAWHRHLARGAKRYAKLTDTERHELRKRAKRLRYATEFCAGLYEPRRVRRYLKALRVLQERLGEVSDLSMAEQVYAERAPQEPAAMYALGWFAARREALIAKVAPRVKEFARIKGYWD